VWFLKLQTPHSVVFEIAKTIKCGFRNCKNHKVWFLKLQKPQSVVFEISKTTKYGF